MPVAEVFLGAFLQVLFDRLASRELLEFATRQGIRSGLKKLEENLKMINKVITRAENTLYRETEVDEWLEQLRDWAFDADDLLDEVNTRAMQEEEEQEEARRNNTSSSIVTMVRDLVPRIISGNKYSKNVRELNSRLDAISERMYKMHNLMNMTVTENTSTTPLPMLRRALEGPALDAQVLGREQEKERIIEQLKSAGDANVEVIAIVGLPGIGKTTLARDVFHSVSDDFDIKGWVCVSNDFDLIRIMRDILESFKASNSRRPNKLLSELKEVVGGKRFLLVLDDVWTRNYFDHCATLRSPFGVGAPGSKILVTTRDDKVASMVQTDDLMKIHRPGPLPDDACWSVFLQHVIDKINPVFESEAGAFRVKILDKCKGLPLTAKLLGGLLRGESRGQGWEAILSSRIWDLSDDEFPGREGGRMLPVVMLSYFELPSHLKRCFSYCSVLPEDYEFGEEEVVSLWMAEGLVLPGRGEQVEDKGAKYFGELVSRSLFQPSPKTPSRFVMHDLINDMAEIVAGKSCFKFDGYVKKEKQGIPAQTRYSSYRHFNGLKMEFEAFERIKYLRTFQSFGRRPWPSNLTSYVPLQLLMKLKYLRVLCLSRYSVRELPEDIGDLIHLRLVDLSHTYITRLPESTSLLYNLQTLKLRGCKRVTTLPAQMRKLVNLRILDCSGPNKLVAMPVKISKLTSLQKLSNFIVGKGSEQGIGQLKPLSHLKESISISFLENVCDSKEARDAELMRKEGLQSVKLKWNPDPGDLKGTGLSFHVFAELQPHKHLKKLIINGYGGLSFPDWVGDYKFSKMTAIKLSNCKKCTKLPPLGKLPVLEEIQIRNMGGIECVGEEFYGKERGAFPSLKILKFEGMENWSIWSHPAGGGCRFECLHELHVINCPKLLGRLPDGISLQILKARKCDELLVALPRPSILEMDIGDCKVELMERLKEDGDADELLPSLTRLNVENVDVVEAVESARIISNKDVVEAHPQMMMLGSLTCLEIASIPKLTHIPGVILQGLPKLGILRIHGCEDLTSLWKMDDGEMEILQKQKSDFLNSLRVLEVEECRQLVCLLPQRGEEDGANRNTHISEKEEQEKQGKQQCLGLPCGLQRLRLWECDKLEKLPSDLHNLTSLGNLDIECCSLTEIRVPSSLTAIWISVWECELLTCLLLSWSSSSSSSTSMGANGMPLPHSDKVLHIGHCKNLESLVGTAAFTEVRIQWCPKLKSLPEGIQHPRLSSLRIEGCENLGELSISVRHLPALKYLEINDCPAGLVSIQQGGPNSLPPNLKELHITAPSSVTPNGNDEQHFSVPLPSSLTELRISNFKTSSPEAFQSLTSLQYLYIWDCPGLTSIPGQLLPPSLLHLNIKGCPGLTSIPDQLLLPSLRYLHISGCPGLTSIPDQLLPPSLLVLNISGCPLLAPEFAKDKGRYWPKVKFIPHVDIDDRSIFDPEEE